MSYFFNHTCVQRFPKYKIQPKLIFKQFPKHLSFNGEDCISTGFLQQSSFWHSNTEMPVSGFALVQIWFLTKRPSLVLHLPPNNIWCYRHGQKNRHRNWRRCCFSPVSLSDVIPIQTLPTQSRGSAQHPLSPWLQHCTCHTSLTCTAGQSLVSASDWRSLCPMGGVVSDVIERMGLRQRCISKHRLSDLLLTHQLNTTGHHIISLKETGESGCQGLRSFTAQSSRSLALR